MKILFAGSLLPHSIGAALCSTELLVGLAHRGHAVRALAPWAAAQDRTLLRRRPELGPAPLEAGAFDREVHPGVTVSRFRVSVFDNVLYPPEAAVREYQKARLRERVRSAMVEERPDVLLLGKESFTPGIPAIARPFDVPSVVTAHGAILAEKPPGYPMEWHHEILEGLRSTDRVLTCARHLAESLRSLGLDPVDPIPNGIDTRRFAPRSRPESLLRSLSLGDDQPIVVHISSFATVKRSLDLVEAAATALRRIPDAVFVIVGDGPERAAMQAACREHRIFDRFRFVGHAPHATIHEYHNLGDVVVVPSQSEGLCRVVLEAQSSATTILASDIPGNRETIEHAATGLLFPTGDHEQLAARLVTILNEPQARERLGRQARQFIETHHARERWILDHEVALESLCVGA